MNKLLIIIAALTLLSCNGKLEKVPVKIEPVKIDSTKIKAYKSDSIGKVVDERLKRTMWICLEELPRLRDKQYSGTYTHKDQIKHDNLIKELRFIASDSSLSKANHKWSR